MSYAREELQQKRLDELKRICSSQQIPVMGDRRRKDTFINAILIYQDRASPNSLEEVNLQAAPSPQVVSDVDSPTLTPPRTPPSSSQFTRTMLIQMKLTELQGIAATLNVEAKGHKGHKISYIDPILKASRKPGCPRIDLEKNEPTLNRKEDLHVQFHPDSPTVSTSSSSSKYTRTMLEGMKLSELKQIAASLNVEAKGHRGHKASYIDPILKAARSNSDPSKEMAKPEKPHPSTPTSSGPSTEKDTGSPLKSESRYSRDELEEMTHSQLKNLVSILGINDRVRDARKKSSLIQAILEFQGETQRHHDRPERLIFPDDHERGREIHRGVCFGASQQPQVTPKRTQRRCRTSVRARESDGLSGLPNVVHDMRDFKNVMTKHLHVDFDEPVLSYVQNQNPNMKSISKRLYMSRLTALLNKKAASYTIYWSGHGEFETGNWLLDVNDESISLDDIITLWLDLSSSTAPHLKEALLFICCDACHSGAWINQMRSSRRFSTRSSDQLKVVIQTACKQDEVSWDGVFTSGFSQKQTNPGHTFSWVRLFEEIKDEPDAPATKDHLQHPIYYCSPAARAHFRETGLNFWLSSSQGDSEMPVRVFRRS